MTLHNGKMDFSNRYNNKSRRGAETQRFFLLLYLVLGLVLVVRCEQEPTPTAVVQEVEPTEITAVPVESGSLETRALPTLYPTPSPFPTPVPTEPLPTSTPRPTATPIDFSELVVEVHFSVPGLGLERSLVGNVSSQLELTDETTDQMVTVTDAPGIMFELQQSLPEVALSELPDGCDLCVRLSYDLFLTGESGEGWLEDPVLLASFENFFSARLGPHFPPDTIVGFRRSATPYNVAHTVALTAEGNLWRWTATEGELNGPEAAGGTLAAILNQLDLETIAEEYLGPCPEGAGFETLYLENDSGQRSVEIICPELSLPIPLVALYLTLDELADDKTADVSLPQPEPAIPLESVLYYQRADGSRLVLYGDGRALARTEEGLTASAALAENQAINTALALADSGNLALGVVSFVADDAENVLIARGLDGVYEVSWSNLPSANLTQVIDELDELLDELLENAESPEDGTPTATPDPDATPTMTPTDEVTPDQ